MTLLPVPTGTASTTRSPCSAATAEAAAIASVITEACTTRDDANRLGNRARSRFQAGGRPRGASSVRPVAEASPIVTGAARAAAERIAGEVWEHNELSFHEV